MSIGEGSSFGAFSFNNHDSETWSINVGIPFKKIRDRNRGYWKWNRKCWKIQVVLIDSLIVYIIHILNI